MLWEQPRDDENNQQHKFKFTLDICNKLKDDVGCHPGTRVCGVREDIDLDGISNSTFHPIDIAGTYAMDSGRKIDAKFERLKTSKSNSDVTREGLRAALHGGKYPDSKNGTDQRAIIEFVCEKERTGLDDEKKDDGDKKNEDGGDREDKKPGEKFIKRDGSSCQGGDEQSLRFCGYANEKSDKGKDIKTLRLEWRTKYACEDGQGAADPGSSSHWGFFTWFIIIFFLGTATYLIFGSWLNYNRYGARGWDLLPHGDTIRDIPYLLKDCARRAKDTIQGPGGRGGYSAV